MNKKNKIKIKSFFCDLEKSIEQDYVRKLTDNRKKLNIPDDVLNSIRENVGLCSIEQLEVLKNKDYTKE